MGLTCFIMLSGFLFQALVSFMIKQANTVAMTCTTKHITTTAAATTIAVTYMAAYYHMRHTGQQLGDLEVTLKEEEATELDSLTKISF